MSFNITVEGGTSVRLPTAGKYCDRDIIVTAEGGGVELDVVTASSLPSTVTDGQIVVITDTTPGTVYIDTDEPASPASGDVWVKLEAEATVKLELSEESPYLRGGLTGASQWDGSKWVACDGYLGVVGVWKQFSSEMPSIGSPLNDFTWEQIASIAASGKATQYFSVGDAKEIKINGPVGNTMFNNLSVWAFIIGFNHNSSVEGNNKIHFQIGKNGQTSATNICLVDSAYNTSAGAGYFSMNNTDSNTSGWKECQMRTTLLGNSNNPSSPLSNSLMAALPSELRGVMKSVTKYTDSSNTESTDYIWLLSEFEVFGTTTNSSSAEKTYQQQYSYYASGNPKVFYKHNSTSTAAIWRLRSMLTVNAMGFCHTNTNGATNTGTTTRAKYSLGLAPCFCV